MNLITDTVDKQLKAYNEKDFKAFSSYYHKDIMSYDLDTQDQIETMCGENFFSHYKIKFKENPEIFCNVTNRIVHGDLVIDKEYITAYKGKTHEEMVIYKIKNGLIIAMWFSKEIIKEAV